MALNGPEPTGVDSNMAAKAKNGDDSENDSDFNDNSNFFKVQKYPVNNKYNFGRINIINQQMTGN